MNFNRIRPFSKLYLVLLLVSIAVLIFSAGMAYRQIKRMQESSEMVAHTYQVNDAIGSLFSHYFRLESEEFREELLKEDRFEEKLKDYKAYGKIVFDSLNGLVNHNASQMRRLQDIKALEDTLYDNLVMVGDSINNDEAELANQPSFPTRNISGNLFKIRNINDQMRAEGRRLMRSRKADYASQRFLAPLTSLVLPLFALFIFIVSFLRIYKNKRRLRESDTFLRSVLASTDNIVNYYEPVYDNKANITDFKIGYANECNRDYLGIAPDFMMDKKISEVFPFVMLNGEFEEMVKSFEKRDKLGYERQVAINNRKLWFVTIVSPLSDGILVVSRNATEEEEAKENQLVLKEQALEDNEKLREAQLFLKNVLANTDNVITYFTPIYDDDRIIDFSIVFNNANIEQVLRKEMSELKNRPISEVLPVHFENGVFEHLVDSCQNNRTVHFENWYTFNGTDFYFKTTAVKLDNGVLSTSSDLTAEQNFKERLKKQNLELMRSNTELESFNRVASHDLQEPLRKIQMFISRINQDNNLPSKEIKYFRKIENAVDRMRSLIFNLLSYSRIDSTHDDFKRIDLNTVLEKVREELSVRVEEKGATIDAEKLPTIKGIFYQMEQLFDNLISNAIKYCKNGIAPKISVRSERVHRNQVPEIFHKTAIHYHRLTFADNGIGFEQKQADKIFEVFQRLHQQSEYSGTGIGLAICKKILENHHGFIDATGELGKGSTFVVYIPA